MASRGQQSDHTTPSPVDGDGVRIIRERSPARRWPVVIAGLALIVAGAGYFFWWSPLSRGAASKPVATAGNTRPETEQRTTPMPTATKPATMTPPAVAPAASPPQSSSADWRTGDANDIATYVSPSDPEPTAAELIKALRDSGERGGIAAFNPPGTSPPLKGLAVPEDFVLPPGFVRHHQVTDAGEPIEAILMYSPDYVFRDAAGNAIPIPEDRVVPPEMAPPGLPIREIEIPPPPE